MKEKEIQENMNKSIEATQRNFNTIRTGRANASLLDRVSVEYYGAETPIKSLATISTVDSQTISIQPFDISCLQAIEKSISCLLYTSPSPRDISGSRMPSSA